MSEKEIFEFLRTEGCCDACCLRFLGLKNPNCYENTSQYLVASKFVSNEEANAHSHEEKLNGSSKEDKNGDETDVSPAKRRRWCICKCCVGVLQHETWDKCVEQVREMFNKKKYSSKTFACGLSSPIAILLREKIITLLLDEKFPEHSSKKSVTPLKEAWKWSFGLYLSEKIDKTLDSGSICPLLITVNMEYPDDVEELEHLKVMTPKHFRLRNQQRKRFNVDFTRRSVELALEQLSLEALKGAGRIPLTEAVLPAYCISVSGTHVPLYLGGRYIKYSRQLPQTPWILNGKRMMESSVQEIIFKPIAELFNIRAEDVDLRLKLLSAGREDVDVRCLGTGRPFAVELSDPTLDLSQEQLTELENKMASPEQLKVIQLKIIKREDLVHLKKGEESKTKVYEALCIKLSHSSSDEKDRTNGDSDIRVTQKDIDNINNYRNTNDPNCRVVVHQKTPIRVLHRRPLLTRTRRLLDIKASLVPGQPQLFVVRVETEAGTYVKEWVHGDARRSSPSLGDALCAATDLIALDVAAVSLRWPL